MLEDENNGCAGYNFHCFPDFISPDENDEYEKKRDSNILKNFRDIPLFSYYASPQELGESDGVSNDSFLGSMCQDFEKNGFVCIQQKKNVSHSNKHFWELLRNEALDNFQTCFQILEKGGKISFPAPYHDDASNGRIYSMGCGIKNGYKEIVMRGPGRFEMTFGCLDEPKSHKNKKCHTLLGHIRKHVTESKDSVLHRLLSQLFKGEEHYLCNMSIVISVPGAAEQSWHADGGHVDLTKHLSCHCLNVFIPLVDVPLSLGPTQFKPGKYNSIFSK